MTLTEEESLVMRFFHAWYSHDFETMRRCMAPDVRFDLGRAPSFDNADDLIDYLSAAPGYRDVTLLECLVHEGRAALLFEGIQVDSSARSRAAVFFRLEEGRVRGISVAVVPLDHGPDSTPSTWRNAPDTVAHGTIVL